MVAITAGIYNEVTKIEKINWYELVPNLHRSPTLWQTGKRRYVLELKDTWAGDVAWKPPGTKITASMRGPRKAYRKNVRRLARRGLVVLDTLEK